MCKRSRTDIQSTAAFLCSRVNSPDEDDWKKLIWLLNFLKDTIALETTLEADNTNIIKWHVDASFAVHPGMRSHKGGAMTLGKGAIQMIVYQAENEYKKLNGSGTHRR